VNSFARWYISKPKITVWKIFVGSCNGRCWYILCPFGLFYINLAYFMAIGYTDYYRFGTLYQEKSGNPGSEKFFHWWKLARSGANPTIGSLARFENKKYFIPLRKML
jgi:hypothetical protein